jgi:hypothetical protein
MTVSILMVRALVAAVEPLAGDRRHWLAAAGFDPTPLEDSAARLTVAAYDGVTRVALEASGDEALGLHMVGAKGGATFDVLAHLASHAATLREGLEDVTRYARIYSETVKLTMHEDERRNLDSRCCVEHDRIVESSDPCRWLHEARGARRARPSARL